jgi:hypothetical protein
MSGIGSLASIRCSSPVTVVAWPQTHAQNMLELLDTHLGHDMCASHDMYVSHDMQLRPAKRLPRRLLAPEGTPLDVQGFLGRPR